MNDYEQHNSDDEEELVMHRFKTSKVRGLITCIESSSQPSVEVLA